MTNRKDPSSDQPERREAGDDTEEPKDRANLPQARGESSLLYSLDALAAATSAVVPSEHDEPPVSGTIDLTKLPKANEVQRAPAVLDAMPVLGFELPEEKEAVEPPKAKSSGGMAIGIGVGVVGFALAAVAFWMLRTPPEPAVTPTPSESASVSAPVPEPTVSASAAPAVSASAAPSATAPKPVATRTPTTRTAPTRTVTAPAETPAEPETPPPEPTPTEPPKPPPPVRPCGCAPNDLKCNMDCAVKGS